MLFLQAKTEAFTMKSVNIFLDTLTASFLWDLSYGVWKNDENRTKNERVTDDFTTVAPRA